MAANDLLTFGEGAIAISHSADELADSPEDAATLRALITSVSTAIEGRIGPVVQRAVTSQCRGGRSLVLPSTPVVSVTTINGAAVDTFVRVNKGAGVLDGTYFTEDPTTNWVTVVYQAGRCADTASVPAHIKQAAALTLADLWRRTKSSFFGTPSYGAQDQPATSAHLLPLAALQLIQCETRGAFA